MTGWAGLGWAGPSLLCTGLAGLIHVRDLIWESWHRWGVSGGTGSLRRALPSCWTRTQAWSRGASVPRCERQGLPKARLGRPPHLPGPAGWEKRLDLQTGGAAACSWLDWNQEAKEDRTQIVRPQLKPPMRSPMDMPAASWDPGFQVPALRLYPRPSKDAEPPLPHQPHAADSRPREAS